MAQGQPSFTAIIVALIRGLHTRTFPQPIFTDPWADRLVPDEVVTVLRQRLAEYATMDDWLSGHGYSASLILRARYAEDALRAAVAEGVDQYVIVGAGLDSFVLRRPDWAAQLRCYEIDHPDTQAFKLQQLRRLGQDPAAMPGTTFIPADLAATSIEAALAGSGFDPARPAFFAWMGVTHYLTPEDNLAALRGMRAIAAHGSAMALNYIGPEIMQQMAEGAARGSAEEAGAAVARLGEPFKGAFTEAQFADLIKAGGWHLAEDLGIDDLIERYRNDGAAALPPSLPNRVARLTA